MGKITSSVDLAFKKIFAAEENKDLIISLINSIFLFVIIIPLMAIAEQKKLPLPRFVSIKSNEVNARVGPTIKSPIEWIFIKKGEPVEIIAEYEQWRQIRDISGEGGWVHSSVLSGKRTVIIISPDIVSITKFPADERKIIAKAHDKVRCLFIKCNGDYCKINCKNKVGWLPKTSLWGVYKNE